MHFILVLQLSMFPFLTSFRLTILSFGKCVQTQPLKLILMRFKLISQSSHQAGVCVNTVVRGNHNQYTIALLCLLGAGDTVLMCNLRGKVEAVCSHNHTKGRLGRTIRMEDAARARCTRGQLKVPLSIGTSSHSAQSQGCACTVYIIPMCKLRCKLRNIRNQ